LFQPEASCAKDSVMLYRFANSLLCLCLVAALSLSSQASALPKPVTDPVLTQAQFAMDDAEYEKALKWIEQGLKRSELSTQTLEKLYWMEGTCYISLEMPQKALTSFQKLLAVSPEYNPSPMSPPKLLRMFEDAKKQHNKKHDLKINLQPRSTPMNAQKANTPVPVRLVVDGAQNKQVIQRVVLYVQPPGDKAFKSLDALSTDENMQTFLATVPIEWLSEKNKPYKVKYYWEILGSNNVLLSNLGTAQAPLNFRVQARQATPENVKTEATPTVNKTPIYIALAVSTVVIAGIVTAVILSQPQTASATVTVSCEQQSCFP